jgi:hypothetical protein
MSSTSRGGKKSPADFYATPPWPVHRLLERLDLPPGWWLEPMAGEGHIIRAVNAVRSDVRWDAIELREECRVKLESLARTGIGSFFDCPPPPETQRPVVSITNPAFSIAMEAILHSLKFAPWVIHLLRLNFLGSKKRNAFFKEMMPDLYVVPDRISFAQSLSCKTCDWAEIYPLDVEVPKLCPRCESKVTVSTTDSIEYAWFVFGPERKRRKGYIEVLDQTPEDQR